MVTSLCTPTYRTLTHLYTHTTDKSSVSRSEVLLIIHRSSGADLLTGYIVCMFQSILRRFDINV